MQQPCTVEISLRNQAVVLRRSIQATGRVAARLVEVLDWGQASGVINSQQRTLLLRELAERSHGLAS